MFAWSPSDLKGINPEVNKLLEAGYVSEVQYTEWLSHVVVVPKESGKWRMCTDFTDLNKACLKDPFPLPRIDLLVDSTAGCELFSMMDAYPGYHQILMAEEDRDKISFITENGIYCYNVIPFDLKNAGATYQCLVNKKFKSLIGVSMEVYVADMLVKSRKSEDHLEHLKQAFDVMRTYGMKLNPTKCTFEVGGGKFLGFMVRERGIEANPEKIEAIKNLASPKMMKETKGFEWNEECEQVLQDLKKYLTSPPLLANPKNDEPLYLYLAVSEEAVSSLLVREESGKGSYETRERSMIFYLKKAKEMITKFDKCAIQHIPRCENERADALSKFGAMMTRIKDRRITVMIKEKAVIEEIVEVQAIESQGSWMDDIGETLRDGIEPKKPVTARQVKFKANRFTSIGD
ncbi:UNVERIFIED_CONTAM: Retrovirus-related Pol polyprotein from transposon gypsy [Sesamum latifolium]|uniref:Retrovirus-related Pol polyprotein from transposon gypsy n=1 Tax=Sesamum latifolium TaxID=2727402 RepID=A0AAW2UFB2_9LAMI